MFDYSVAINNGNVFNGNVYVEDGAVIGKGNQFNNNCTISKYSIIGDNNIFETSVSIGSASRERLMGIPSKKSLTNCPHVVIGNGNLFEDGVSIQLPLESSTKIMDDVCVGAFSHVAHDSLLCNQVILASHCSIGGYSILLKGANLGMGVRVHQRTVIGALAMVGAGCVVVNHIAPATKVVGVPARFLGVNQLGLKRNGVNQDDIKLIKQWLLSGSNAQKLFHCASIQVKEFYESLNIWYRERPIIPIEKK